MTTVPFSTFTELMESADYVIVHDPEEGLVLASTWGWREESDVNSPFIVGFQYGDDLVFKPGKAVTKNAVGFIVGDYFVTPVQKTLA